MASEEGSTVFLEQPYPIELFEDDQGLCSAAKRLQLVLINIDRADIRHIIDDLRKVNPTISIIAMSGELGEATIRLDWARLYGANDQLYMPTNREEMSRMISQYVDFGTAGLKRQA